MKKNIIVLLTMLAVILFGCASEPETYEPETPIKEEIERELYGKNLNVEIIKVRDCEYVYVYASVGVDITHYEGCTNVVHKYN